MTGRGRDLHASLKTEIVSNQELPGLRMVLTKLAWGKNDTAFSLHVAPNTYSTAGIQMTDLLSFCGFVRGVCPFSGTGECYARWFDETFSVPGFAQGLKDSYTALKTAYQHFEACGFLLPQPEGWGFHYGKPSSRVSARFGSQPHGDGHTSPHTEVMKQSEDENFEFAFSWIDGGVDKGWTTHYRPKVPPLSLEVSAVFGFLELREFKSCPMFDFEACAWRFAAFQARDSHDSNAGWAHQWFDAHAQNFSLGIERILAAQAAVAPFGAYFFPLAEGYVRRTEAIIRHVVPPKVGKVVAVPEHFDVAISFAGTEREFANRLASAARDAGFQVFFDDYYKAALWGKDLVEFFDDIYRKRSRHCVMFISRDYAERMWTTLERRSALARWLEERGNDYILPIRCDGTEILGLPPTVGYVSIVEHNIDEIAALLIEKLSGPKGQ